jgi:site-specific DNA-methyltransferase (adenine-specific)
MGKEWDGGDIAFRQETWELAMKLLKPGGHLLAFSASRNYHRMAVAIEDAGFEIRDQIMWIYGSGFPKSLNIGKAVDKKQGNDRVAVGERTRNVKPFDDDNGWNSNNTNGNHIYTKGNSEWEGWGTALKPAHEPIVLARKPISEKTIIDNVLKHGTGGINIDECRVELRKGEKTEKKPTKLISSTVNFNASEMRGSVDSKWKLGRFPANVMHDGSDVITKEFPQTGKFGSVKPIDKQKTNDVFGKYNEVKEFQAYDDEGSAARFFYCPKTSKSERGEDNSHPTVKPIALMRYLCRLVTPKGGTVLDPFMGSGSTGMAAKDEGFEFIGIEREKEYFEIAEKRIKAASPLMEFM